MYVYHFLNSIFNKSSTWDEIDQINPYLYQDNDYPYLDNYQINDKHNCLPHFWENSHYQAEILLNLFSKNDSIDPWEW